MNCSMARAHRHLPILEEAANGRVAIRPVVLDQLIGNRLADPVRARADVGRLTSELIVHDASRRSLGYRLPSPA